MKTILVMGLLALSSNAFSSVVKSYDSENKCSLYRVISENSEPQQNNETLVSSKEVYGLGIQDLEIDFNSRKAKVNVIMNIVLGFNHPVVQDKVSIDEKNPQFKMLINQLNRKLSLLENVCISKDNKLVYGKIMDTN